MKRTFALLAVLTTLAPVVASARPVSHDLRRGPPGVLVVDNDRFVPVEVFVDGRGVGSVRAEAQSAFRLRSGVHSVRVATRAGKTIVKRDVKMTPRTRREIEVAAHESKLSVRNQTPIDAVLSINGRRFGDVRAGASVSVIRSPGPVRLALTSRGRVIDETTYTLRSGVKRTWNVDRALLSTLRIDNDLRRTVTVLIDGKDRGELSGGTARSFELKPGTHRLLILSDRGRVLERHQIQTRRFDDVKLTIERPNDRREDAVSDAELWELMFDALFDALAEAAEPEDSGFEHDHYAPYAPYAAETDEHVVHDGQTYHCEEGFSGQLSCSLCSH